MDTDTVAEPVTVGIVDDHPVVIEGVTAWLGGDPRIDLIASGDTIDAVLGTDGPHPDVLVLDLNLHGRLVIDETAKLAQTGQRVIVFSQHAERDVVLAALEAGAYAYLTKDEGRDHLVEAVLAASTDHPYVAPAEAGTLLADRRPQRPKLSTQEQTALILWFQSAKKAAVAHKMGISVHTVDMYIKRARLKYVAAQRPAPTKAALLARAIADGLLDPNETDPPAGP